jgi:hypothetical protein
MQSRRTFLATAGAAVAGMAGCLGPSGGDSDDENDDQSEGPSGEVDNALGDSLSVEQSARFEDATIDQNLIVEGTVTNDGGDSTVSAELALDTEQFRRNDTQTVELGPGESADFELTLTSVYAQQFDGYTLSVTETSE